MSKAQTAFVTLGMVASVLQKKADVYASLNSQDADFKDMQQQVNAALALPDDPAPDAPPPEPPPPADYAPALAELNAKLDGLEDVLGAIMAALPAPAPQQA